jgi:hypothetical protein
METVPVTIDNGAMDGSRQPWYSPDKINVNPDFIKSNYLTCSNKNVKKTIAKIYDGYPPPKLQVEFRKLAVFIYLPLFENDLP